MDRTQQIDLIRTELATAAEAIVDAAAQCLDLTALARDGDEAALAALDPLLCRIIEACSFQDLAGQRLSRLASPRPGPDPLLNGPADPGAGLDQHAADRLLAAAGR